MSERLFGDEGNFEDYWLGTPSYDNTFLVDNEGWFSLETFLRDQRKREQKEWTPERDMIDKILGDMPNASDRAGGVMDVTEEFLRARSKLIARGKLALEFQRGEKR